MKGSEAEQLYLEILGPTSPNLESGYAFIMCRPPKGLCGDKWAEMHVVLRLCFQEGCQRAVVL